MFNHDDGHSMTFMGLWIDESCNLIHIHDEKRITAKSNYMAKSLRDTLDKNGVQFMEEYEKLGKYD